MSETSVGTKSRLPKFMQKGRIGGYLSVVLTGQFVYVSFEAFKGSLLDPMTQALGISVADFGKIMTVLGFAMFMYVPAGWVNNRFPIRKILIAFASWRLLTFLFLWLSPVLGYNLNLTALLVIAATWAVWDAIGWPAVVNGVTFMASDSDSKGRGLAMGLLESLRRGLEFCMNLIVIGCIAAFPTHANGIMIGFGLGYSLLLIPNIFAILRFVPANAVAESEGHSKNTAALMGLGKVLIQPRVWFAGIAGMCVYWAYVNLIYSSAPYLTRVYQASTAQASTFGIFSTGFVGIIAGLVAGVLADYIFKSSTTMMAVALTVIAIGVGVVYLLPVSDSMMWPAMIFLIVMAFGVFLGKSVILAPIAELHLPEDINGSAMSVGSFLVYAPVIWANYSTSNIIDSHAADPAAGYHIIFLITLCVAAVGAACAYALVFSNRRSKAKEAVEAK